MATLVKFRIDKEYGDVFAYFPKLNYNPILGNQKMSYAHIGQHSACSPEYAKECRKASEAEYCLLKKELEDIGYVLKVCKN